MDKLKIAVTEDKSINLHFGSWVMGQLAQRGWGYELSTVLAEIAKNPFDSMATLVYLGQCSALDKSKSLGELSKDDAHDLLDEISSLPGGDLEVIKIRDAFLTSAFGEKVVEALNNLKEEDLEATKEPKKKVVKLKPK